MHVEELLKLRSMQNKLSEVLLTLQHRKELYEALPQEEKVYALMKLMEQLLEEVGELMLFLQFFILARHPHRTSKLQRWRFQG